MSESASATNVRVSATRSRLNPRRPAGSTWFNPRDVAYIVDVPITRFLSGNQLIVVTSSVWVPGWDVGKRVRMATNTSSMTGSIAGIMDFATHTVEGSVPNLRLGHWRVESVGS